MICSFLLILSYSISVRGRPHSQERQDWGGGYPGDGFGRGKYGGPWRVPNELISCADFYIDISASAANLVIPGNLNLSAITAANISTVQNSGNHYSSQTVFGKFTISARFCEPQVYNASRYNTLQFLVHGDGYTKEYWSGLSPPGRQPFGPQYSWIDYASSQGYPTLSIDRICNGKSTKANGTSICQVPMNAAVNYQIIQMARNGQFGRRRMSSIVYVGHSLGSIIANYLASTIRDDQITYILTGFTPYGSNGSLGTLVATSVRPAKSASSAYASYTDPSYLVETNATGYKGVFYYGDYSQDVESYDYANRGPVTVGELISSYLGQITVPDYAGNLFALNGANDQIFCSRNIYDPIQGNLGDCGPSPFVSSPSYSAAVQSLYPGLRRFGWFQAGQTGHCLNLHNTYLASFQAAQNFLTWIGL